MDSHLEITEHFVRAQARYIAERGKLKISRGESFEPFFLIVCRVSPHDGQPLDTSLACIPVSHQGGRSSEAKEATLFAVRAIAIAGNAIGVITCLNSFAVFAEGDAAKKLLGDVRAGTFSLENHDARVETTFTFIEWESNKVECVEALKVTRDQGFVDFDAVPSDFTSSMVEGNGALMTMPPHNDLPTPDIIDAARDYARRIVIDRRDIMREQAARGEVARG